MIAPVPVKQPWRIGVNFTTYSTKLQSMNQFFFFFFEELYYIFGQPIYIIPGLYSLDGSWWPSERLQYLQCVSTWDTTISLLCVLMSETCSCWKDVTTQQTKRRSYVKIMVGRHKGWTNLKSDNHDKRDESSLVTSGIGFAFYLSSLQSSWFSLISVWPGHTIWWHKSQSTLVQVMACCLFAAKPSTEPMLTSRPLDTQA